MGPTWLSRRAVFLHLTALIVVPGCLALGWWQLQRALSGNALSWAYTFEWPFFACYGVYMWWRILHEQPIAGAANETGGHEGANAGELARLEEDDEEEAELAAYNRYLARLHSADERKAR